MTNEPIYVLMRFDNAVQYGTDKSYLEMLAERLNQVYPSRGFYVNQLEKDWVYKTADEKHYS